MLDAPQPLVEIPQLALRAHFGHVPGVDQDVGTRQVLSNSKSRPEKHAKKSTKRGFRVVGGHFLLSHIKIYKGTVYIYIYSIYIYMHLL